MKEETNPTNEAALKSGTLKNDEEVIFDLVLEMSATTHDVDEEKLNICAHIAMKYFRNALNFYREKYKELLVKNSETLRLKSDIKQLASRQQGKVVLSEEMKKKIHELFNRYYLKDKFNGTMAITELEKILNS